MLNVFLPLIVLVLFSPLSVLKAQAVICEQLNVEGSTAFPELMGTYMRKKSLHQLRPDDSDIGLLRPVYQILKPPEEENQGFIFHQHGAWYIGMNSSSWETVCGIAVRDEARSPERVKHTWQEMGPYSGHWNPISSIKVSCSSSSSSSSRSSDSRGSCCRR
mmetsp:Transcript_12871/g.21448  ORF Transcript_12871/g.21448 Transcript_12871/m.21448 type:complete len:161 (+) Transcript_12871:254-736(+)